MNKQELIQLCEEAIQQEPNSFTGGYPWAKPVPPPKEDKVKGGLLEPWWEIYNDDQEVLYVRGYISDDSRFRDGEVVRTSYVVNLDYNEVLKTGEVETRNTVYTLGGRLILPTGL